MIDLPNAIFKYLPLERIDVLMNLLIRFTQASSMNDTLEFRWPTSGVEQPDKLSLRIKEKLYPRALAAIPKEKRDSLDAACGLPGLAEQLIENHLEEIARKGSVDRNLRHKEIAEKAFRKLDSNYGILSLSELPTDLQMWSHYADGGRGFLIEFDPEHSWFHATRNPGDGFNELTRVEYVPSRPAKNLLDIKDEVLYTKPEAYRYEQEWRIVRSFNDAARKLGSLDCYGNEILLFSIPPNAVRSVIIGYGSGPKLETEIRSILGNNPNLKRVKVKRAIQSPETGRISIVPVGVGTAQV